MDLYYLEERKPLLLNDLSGITDSKHIVSLKHLFSRRKCENIRVENSCSSDGSNRTELIGEPSQKYKDESHVLKCPKCVTFRKTLLVFIVVFLKFISSSMLILVFQFFPIIVSTVSIFSRTNHSGNVLISCFLYV